MVSASARTRRLQFVIGAAAVALLSAAAINQALAQAWPSRTITAIVPFAAGNANDIVGRIVLDQVS
jgi:tripartite-type tricarboxylate transporter receptor subunit TctC